MSGLGDLPDWVWDLIDALDAYEDEHPSLYRMTAAAEYERVECFGTFLSSRNAWPPREVLDAALFRRQVLRAATDGP